MKTRLFYVLLISLFFCNDANAQITSSDIIGAWSYSNWNKSRHLINSYTFNEDYTGESNYDISYFDDNPSYADYTKVKTAFRWAIKNGQVIAIPLSMKIEKMESGQWSFEEIDMSILDRQKNMEVTFTDAQKRCIKLSGFFVVVNESFCK